jgi:hypothetical protein
MATTEEEGHELGPRSGEDGVGGLLGDAVCTVIPPRVLRDEPTRSVRQADKEPAAFDRAAGTRPVRAASQANRSGKQTRTNSGDQSRGPYPNERSR